MKRIWTVGHSNRTLEEFLQVVRDIEIVADVRRYPVSRKFPHFNRESLERAKDYRGCPALGGRRSEDGARHAALRAEGFRSYAAYMETEEFRAALEELEALASTKRTAVLCAEARWDRCHRGLLSDFLTVRAWEVRHLPDGEVHSLNPKARLEGERLVYDRKGTAMESQGELF